jgi:dimethylglycine dehydrogenase
MSEVFPTHGRVVIVGGGIMGCGLAYHLAHEGWSDVVLLEKAELTSGSPGTRRGRSPIRPRVLRAGQMRRLQYRALFRQRWRPRPGKPSPGTAAARSAWPIPRTRWTGCARRCRSGGRWASTSSWSGPTGCGSCIRSTISMASSARCTRPTTAMWTLRHHHGAGRGRAATGRADHPPLPRHRHQQLPNGEWVVETEKGDILRARGQCRRHLCAADGRMVRLQLPMTSMTHHYLVTDTVPEFRDLERELPVIRDDKKVSGYIRMEQKSGLIGIYEKANPNTVWLDHCPWEAENELFEADYDRIMPWLENANRMPIFAELGIKREVHGAISHPPDGNPLIGPAPGVKNYWCCCGTQIGIGWGPGLTRELARWMVHGAADISMRDFDPRRFGLRHEGVAGDQGRRKTTACATRSRSRISTGSRAARSSRRRCTSAEGQGRGVRGSLRLRAPALVRPDGVAQEDHYLPPHVVHDMVAIEVQRRARARRASWTSPPSPRSRSGPGRLCAARPADRQPAAAETRAHHA